MEIIKNANGKAVIKVGKYLDKATAKDFKKILFDVTKKGVMDVRLDFSDTEGIDSSGLGKLLFFNELLKERGGQFQIGNVINKELRDLFELIQIDKLVDIEF